MALSCGRRRGHGGGGPTDAPHVGGESFFLCMQQRIRAVPDDGRWGPSRAALAEDGVLAAGAGPSSLPQAQLHNQILAMRCRPTAPSPLSKNVPMKIRSSSLPQLSSEP